MPQGIKNGSRRSVLGRLNSIFGCLKTVTSGKLKNILFLFIHVISIGTKCHSLKKKDVFFSQYTQPIFRKFPIH